MEVKMRALLDQPDDFKLFSEGGCAVFARALHEEFGYQCAWIPGHDGICVSHVFALLPNDRSHGVDVLGTASIDRLIDRLGGTQVAYLTVQELEGFSADPNRGIFTKQWFIAPAMERARLHIKKFQPYFDGTKQQEIPL